LVLTPWMAVPAWVNAGHWSRKRRFSRVHPAAPGMSVQLAGSGVGVPVPG
jgi:hypothetical protein